MSKREYTLDGLNCANCASKIEQEVGALAEVAEAYVNLMNSTLSVTLAGTEAGNLTELVKKIVAAHEPSVKVIERSHNKSLKKDEHDHDHDHGESAGEMKAFFLRLGGTLLITVLLSIMKAPVVVETVAFIIAYLLIGYEILLSAAKNIIKGKVFDENFLMGVASLGAFIIGDQVEAISVLVFYGIGELLQDLAVTRSKKNITGLMDIRPDYANIIRENEIITVAPEEVKPGDRIAVKPGEKIPLDGVVLKGNSFIDTRALTGESVPREVIPGDTVLSGTINTSGLLEVEVTKSFEEATVNRILELVQNAGSKKAQSEKFITKFARYYTPAVVYAAVAVAILPPLLGFGPFSVWIYRALSFLIISCPCALVISIPLSFFGGIGGGAKHGILVKGGNYLDALQKVDTVVFDKTGTLTKGVFRVSKVHTADDVTGEELLRLAAAAEKHSLHPIAQSITEYCNHEISAEVEDPLQINELAGHGVIAVMNEGTVYAGNDKLMQKYGIAVPETVISGSIVHVALDQKYLGYILISDELKSGVKETLSLLKQLGVKKTVMLTGDHESSAREIAELSGVDEYRAELLPQDKVTWFDTYKAGMTESGRIIFVGDGINDAPVLAGADIGIAMGGVGSDAAIEAADVVIMNDDIGKLVTAIRIARKTKRIVLQNIVFALGVKLLIMLLAFFGVTSIWFAIFADVGVALIALLNAVRAMHI